MYEDTQALAPRLSVAELVPIFAQAERDVMAAFAMIERATQSLDRAFTLESTSGFSIGGYRHGRIDFAHPKEVLTELRRQAWRTLVERLELRRAMSIRAWEELDKQLRTEHEVPEVTAANVSAMADQYTSRLPEMLREAVEEIFNWLRPPGSRYKTNTEFEIRERVILSGVVSHQYGAGMRVSCYRQPHLTALENVFTALDGRGSVTKGHYSQLSEEIKKSDKGQTEYFGFRVFQNGNLHLKFLRLDLLDKFNQIAGGARLRP